MAAETLRGPSDAGYGSNRAQQAFVWSVWVTMMLTAVVFLVKYGRPFPFTEDWQMVPALTGHEPNFALWLWEQVNEHRVPLPKLVYLFLLSATDGDFRVGMVFNIIALGLLSAAMVLTARTIRGGITRVTDAFFPVVLLNLGHVENLFWGWQITQVIPTVAACVVLLVLVVSRASLSPVVAGIAGFSLVTMPLSGLNGVIYAPFLAGWLGYRGLSQWRARDKEQGPGWSGLVLLLCAVLAICLTVLYFVGYQRPIWIPRPSGLDAWLLATGKFLALSLGPSAMKLWAVSITIVLLMVGSGWMLALWSVRRSHGPERLRVLGMLVFLGAATVFAFGIGWGRAGAIPLFGQWPLRYSLFAVPLLCAAYFIWDVYGPTTLRRIIQGTLFIAVCVLLPLNTNWGLSFINWHEEKDRTLKHDLFSGTPATVLADRHELTLDVRKGPKHLVELMRMLQDKGYGPFTAMARDASEETINGSVLPLMDAPSTILVLADASETQTVRTEIRYRAPDAEAVDLIWGLDGWSVVSEAWRPAGTELRPIGPKKARLMHTPMVRNTNTFMVSVSIPVGMTMHYGFLARFPETVDPFWDGDYQVRPIRDAVLQIQQKKPSILANLLDQFSALEGHGIYYLAAVGTLLAAGGSLFVFLPQLKS